MADDLLLAPLEGLRCVAGVGAILGPGVTMTRPCGKPTAAYDATYVNGHEVIVALCHAHATELDGGPAAGDWPQRRPSGGAGSE